MTTIRCVSTSLGVENESRMHSPLCPCNELGKALHTPTNQHTDHGSTESRKECEFMRRCTRINKRDCPKERKLLTKEGIHAVFPRLKGILYKKEPSRVLKQDERADREQRCEYGQHHHLDVGTDERCRRG